MLAHIALDEFERRVGIRTSDFSRSWRHITKVVSLREIGTVLAVESMRFDYLRELMVHVRLAGNDRSYPYSHASISTGCIDPHTLKIGQTFVEQKKLLGLLGCFHKTFERFCVAKGLARLGPMNVFGVTRDGAHCLAHYVPPITELNGSLVLLDGVHRSYLALNVGSVFESVLVEHPQAPFPCTPCSWDSVEVVQEKPAKEKRFHNLNPAQFRDLTYVGIDG